MDIGEIQEAAQLEQLDDEQYNKVIKGIGIQIWREVVYNLTANKAAVNISSSGKVADTIVEAFEERYIRKDEEETKQKRRKR